jgi:hypothetical protein
MNADIRLALRQLRKAPGFALTAVLTLALAIGANAIVFSVLNALILRPLNVPHPETLFMLERAYGSDTSPSESYPDYRDLRDRNRSFDSLVLYNIMGGVGLDTGHGNPSVVWPYTVSGNYFDAPRHSALSWPIYPCFRRTWDEQRARDCSELCALAQQL